MFLIHSLFRWIRGARLGHGIHWLPKNSWPMTWTVRMIFQHFKMALSEFESQKITDAIECHQIEKLNDQQRNKNECFLSSHQFHKCNDNKLKIQTIWTIYSSKINKLNFERNNNCILEAKWWMKVNKHTNTKKMRFIFPINYAHTDLHSTHNRCVNISISNEQKKIINKAARPWKKKLLHFLGYWMSLCTCITRKGINHWKSNWESKC